MRTSPLFNQPHAVMIGGSTWLGPWRFPDGQDADLWVWSNSYLMVVWGPSCYVGIPTAGVRWGALDDTSYLPGEGHEGDRRGTARMLEARAGLRAAAARTQARNLPVWGRRE